MKKLTLLFAMLFCIGVVMAQTTVDGVITDVTGEPLIGANVVVKGTTTGTITDIDGGYSITLPEGSNTLTVSYIGYDDKDMVISGPGTHHLTLEADSQLIDEIVVTGLGIKRDKKALGYGVTTIESADIELKPEADVSRVLRGKVPGVDIISTSGLSGSGTNVVIRGFSSISGDNQALFVVDGVPFSSGTNSDRRAVEGNASVSSRFLDLDPNNIAEVSVLKGLSATVLYGEAGKNGVILITTKNGSDTGADRDKGFEITLDQSIFTNRIASLPDDQDSYGNGFWNNASAAFSNWGAPFNPGVHSTILNQAFQNGASAYDISNGTIPHPYDRADYNLPQYTDARYAYQPYDNLQDFFKTGLILNTSIFANKNVGENSSINFSFARRNEEGFIPLSELNRTNVSVGATTKLANNITLKATLNYVNLDKTAPPTAASTSSNPDNTGDFASGSLFSNVFYTPRSIDLNGLEFSNPFNNSSIFYRGGNDIQHPYWTLNNTKDAESVDRLYGTFGASYDITEWLGVNYRIGFDSYTQNQEYSINKGGTQVATGLLATSDRNISIQDHNFNLRFSNNISEDFDVDAILGLNLRNDKSRLTETFSRDQFVYGLLIHDNFINTTAESFTSNENLIGAFGSFTFGFRNFAYLNLSARNDWTSTLESDHNAVFYPSASLSFIATEAIPSLQNSNSVSYLKVRAGYGTSAGYPNPYATRNILGVSTAEFVTQGGVTINTNTVDDIAGNRDLQPETHTELEFGLEARFLKNRVGIDLSWYDKDSRDLILDFPMDPATGFDQTTINVAEVNNTGVELGLFVIPFTNDKFNTRLYANFTRNENTVVSLADGVDNFVTDALYSDLGPAFYEGQPYGLIVSDILLRNEAGDPIVSSNGFYQLDPELGIIADPNPDYNLNGGLSFGFKGLTFSALMSYQHGGEMYATGPSTLLARGILAESDFDRFIPVIAPGVLDNGDGTYRPNDVQITATDHYWRNGGVFNQELRVYDATFVKLREISVSFAVPADLMARTPFGSASITLSGQNLWFNALGFPEGANFDPEVSALGVSNYRGFELMNVPASKQIGGSIRFTF